MKSLKMAHVHVVCGILSMLIYLVAGGSTTGMGNLTVIVSLLSVLRIGYNMVYS